MHCHTIWQNLITPKFFFIYLNTINGSNSFILFSKNNMQDHFSTKNFMFLPTYHKYVTGLKGKSNRRLITLEEVKQHKNTEGHIWTVLKGRVYNISPYLKFHPGGKGLKKN